MLACLISLGYHQDKTSGLAKSIVQELQWPNQGRRNDRVRKVYLQ